MTGKVRDRLERPSERSTGPNCMIYRRSRHAYQAIYAFHHATTPKQLISLTQRQIAMREAGRAARTLADARSGRCAAERPANGASAELRPGGRRRSGRRSSTRSCRRLAAAALDRVRAARVEVAAASAARSGSAARRAAADGGARARARLGIGQRHRSDQRAACTDAAGARTASRGRRARRCGRGT